MIYTAFGCAVGLIFSLAVLEMAFLPALIGALVGFIVISFLVEGI